jgi:hypothetical protein
MFYVFAETNLLRSRYFVAVHSGFKELREGITFIIDTTDDSMLARQGIPRISILNISSTHHDAILPGNEQKLQKTYQSFPLRPQALWVLPPITFPAKICTSALWRPSLQIHRRCWFGEANVRSNAVECERLVVSDF